MLATLLSRVRQNHSLEHATINLLSRKYPQAQILGLSGPLGFTLYTSLSGDEVVPAARQALLQLQSGNQALRIHANCGTNLVVTALLTTFASLLGIGLRADIPARERLERLPQTVVLNVLALLIARPLAFWVQAYITTDPQVENLEIASVFTDYQGNLRRIRVHTR